MSDYQMITEPEIKVIPFASVRWVWSVMEGKLWLDVTQPEARLNGSFFAGIVVQDIDRKLLLQLSQQLWAKIKDDVKTVQDVLMVARGGELKPGAQIDAEKRIKAALNEFVVEHLRPQEALG